MVFMLYYFMAYLLAFSSVGFFRFFFTNPMYNPSEIQTIPLVL